jgi:hypothetical protein
LGLPALTHRPSSLRIRLSFRASPLPRRLFTAGHPLPVTVNNSSYLSQPPPQHHRQPHLSPSHPHSWSGSSSQPGLAAQITRSANGLRDPSLTGFSEEGLRALGPTRTAGCERPFFRSRRVERADVGREKSVTRASAPGHSQYEDVDHRHELQSCSAGLSRVIRGTTSFNCWIAKPL